MGNHSDTGEVLEEAWAVPVKRQNTSVNASLTDESGNTIKLDQSAEELTNPTRLKDSSDRDVVMIRNAPPNDGMKLTPKQADEIIAKQKKKKAS